MQVKSDAAADIGAAVRASRPTAAEEGTENAVPENIAKRPEDVADVLEPAGSRAVMAEAFFPVAVVNGALFGVFQNLVGFGGEFELGHGFFISGVAVGMIFHRQLTVGLLYFFVRRGRRYAEYFIRICHFDTFFNDRYTFI